MYIYRLKTTKTVFFTRKTLFNLFIPDKMTIFVPEFSNVRAGFMSSCALKRMGGSRVFIHIKGVYKRFVRDVSESRKFND